LAQWLCAADLLGANAAHNHAAARLLQLHIRRTAALHRLARVEVYSGNPLPLLPGTPKFAPEALPLKEFEKET